MKEQIVAAARIIRKLEKAGLYCFASLQRHPYASIRQGPFVRIHLPAHADNPCESGTSIQIDVDPHHGRPVVHILPKNGCDDTLASARHATANAFGQRLQHCRAGFAMRLNL